MRRLSDRGNADQAPALVTPASAAAAGAGAGGRNQQAISNASFNANMVIILSVLLCVLICALGLNSVIRCVLHCARCRLAPPPAAAATATTTRTRSAPSATAGLKKKALRRIPVEVYGPKAGIPATECAICLGEFADGEKVRVLPRCHHGFHVRCIDMWLATHSSCPTCRDSLLEEEGGAGAATAAGHPI